jgi:hypothetical protein
MMATMATPVRVWEGAPMTTIVDVPRQHNYGGKLECPASHIAFTGSLTRWLRPQQVKEEILRYENAFMTIVFARDISDQGTVTINGDGGVVLHYPLEEHDKQTILEGCEKLVKISAAVGAEQIWSTLTRTEEIHPLCDAVSTPPAPVGTSSEKFIDNSVSLSRQPSDSSVVDSECSTAADSNADVNETNAGTMTSVSQHTTSSTTSSSPHTYDASDSASSHANAVKNIDSFSKLLREKSFKGRNAGNGVFSAHQMGTCRMSADSTKGVCKESGEVWEVDDLYVADTSLFPTSVGVNPMITCYAVTYDCARQLVGKMKKEDELTQLREGKMNSEVKRKARHSKL